MGKIAELQCAEWLETRHWTILGLEAMRPGPDIEATTSPGMVTAFELKSIGTEDDDFAMILESMAQGPSAGAVSPYAAINYLLFRMYEAGKQLMRFRGHRIAVVIIDDLTWWRFEMPLNGHWINWANPSFFSGDQEWEMFMKKQEHRYPALSVEVRSVMGGIDQVWIIRRSYGYEYQLEYELNTGSISSHQEKISP